MLLELILGHTGRQSHQAGSGEGNPASWLNWAERHPGMLVVGLLLAAAVLLAHEPARPHPEVDVTGDEIPLFI